MTRTESNLSTADLQALLSDIIRDAGAWRVLRVVASQIVHRHRHARYDEGMTMHLRRDIGLPPSHSPPPKRPFMF